MSQNPQSARQPTNNHHDPKDKAANPLLAQLATEEATSQALKAKKEKRWVGLRPLDAATIIIIERAAEKAPKVLMGKRHAGHKFMPGKFVFPGGRIDVADRFMPVASRLHPEISQKLQSGTPKITGSRAQALALTTLRETYEETGLMIGARANGNMPALTAPQQAALMTTPWQGFLEQGVLPELSKLHYIARAITPPNRPKRFDTRFFVAEAQDIVHRVEGIVGPDSELVELVWVDIAEARTLDLPNITRVVLAELEQRLRDGFNANLPVPFYFERYSRFERHYL